MRSLSALIPPPRKVRWLLLVLKLLTLQRHFAAHGKSAVGGSGRRVAIDTIHTTGCHQNAESSGIFRGAAELHWPSWLF
jgi:hypothetical protein